MGRACNSLPAATMGPSQEKETTDVSRPSRYFFGPQHRYGSPLAPGTSWFFCGTKWSKKHSSKYPLRTSESRAFPEDVLSIAFEGFAKRCFYDEKQKNIMHTRDRRGYRWTSYLGTDGCGPQVKTTNACCRLDISTVEPQFPIFGQTANQWC